MSVSVLQLNAEDNVLIALRDLHKSERISCNRFFLTLPSDVPAKHKFAVEELTPGSAVRMYGVIVGTTMQNIRPGEVVSPHNTRHETSGYQPRRQDFHWNPPDVTRWRGRTFLGYRRTDGQVGTRNFWLVLPLVFCENRNISVLRQAFEDELGFAPPQVHKLEVSRLAQLYREGGKHAIENDFSVSAVPPALRPKLFNNVDGVKFLMHEGGCGGTREDAQNLCELLAGYVHHPNVAGATVLSLGCQHSQVEMLNHAIHRRDFQFDKPLFIFEQQKCASESSMISEAIRATFLGLIDADAAVREPASLSHLCVGLKCGGSDGFSGISANPAIGHVSDVLAALGGTTILSEFPELCGVEQELINRCVSDATADRFVRLLEDYAARARAVRSGFDMNPSPGNIRDGIVTDAMKSAGAARKGGTSQVTAVLDYPEYVSEQGLNLLCTPGNDVECVTAQVGSGASIVLFTTGLGTPTGNPISPVIKISTNSALARRMQDIVDVDAGPIISGELTVQEMGGTILELVIQVASGNVRTKAELQGQNDFIPWKRGVSL